MTPLCATDHSVHTSKPRHWASRLSERPGFCAHFEHAFELLACLGAELRPCKDGHLVCGVALLEAHNRQVHHLWMGSTAAHLALRSVHPEPCFFPQHKPSGFTLVVSTICSTLCPISPCFAPQNKADPPQKISGIPSQIGTSCLRPQPKTRPATPEIVFQTKTIPTSTTVTVPTPHLTRNIHFSII